jgi:hypothetical protein
MKHLASILAIYLLFTSCRPETKETKHIEYKSYRLDMPYIKVDLNEYVIDSCQYIGETAVYSRSNYLTHKGNCNNPIHKK